MQAAQGNWPGGISSNRWPAGAWGSWTQHRAQGLFCVQWASRRAAGQQTEGAFCGLTISSAAGERAREYF